MKCVDRKQDIIHPAVCQLPGRLLDFGAVPAEKTVRNQLPLGDPPLCRCRMYRIYRLRAEQGFAAEGHNRRNAILAREITHNPGGSLRVNMHAGSAVLPFRAVFTAACAGVGDNKFDAVQVFDILVHDTPPFLIPALSMRPLHALTPWLSCSHFIINSGLLQR